MSTGSDVRWAVLKFGGTSVSSLARWETIARAAAERREEGLRLVLVCSAISGISDLLEGLPDAARAGEHKERIEEIEARHKELAEELGADSALLEPCFEEIRRLAKGVSLVREASPRVRAKLLAQGELMSTALGAAYLKKKGLPVSWQDARECLLVQGAAKEDARSFLHAVVPFDKDEELIERFEALGDVVVLTQGFIAGGISGQTVLLGRGGSDVSGAYFAAKLGAERCEIWTDVPGMYTANPRKVPAARLLRSLDYGEAQEIASSGARVLHPRCLTPLRAHGIPMEIRCMDRPSAEGTRIGPHPAQGGAQVKAISSKSGVTLVSMETVDMWHQVGFLADVFGAFKRRGLSVDLVSTSETNVTVSLDKLSNPLEPSVMAALSEDLGRFCKVRILSPCAFVSLVGRDIRGILHRLGPALEVFEEQKIYLVSQAANDLNLTFVVDENQAERLVAELHEQLFSQRRTDALLGLSWKELLASDQEASCQGEAWWRTRARELTALAGERSPLYVYDQAALEGAVAGFAAMKAPDRKLYSVKANPHPGVIRAVHAGGLGFECVSLGEVERVLELCPGLDPEMVLFTPNFVPRIEYERALELGVRVTVDNLYVLESWPEVFRGREIFVRLDPGRGRGHHRYVHTAGARSKFGVPPEDIDALAGLVAKSGARVTGLHAHPGSNIFDPRSWSETALYLAKVAERFPDVRVLDLGGGLGVVEMPGRDALDIEAVDASLLEIKASLPGKELWLEPGRWLIARAGVLLARVTQTKRKKDHMYVGLDAGMNALIRPALYGSHHEIVNLSRLDGAPCVVADIVGPICESGDTLGYSRTIVDPREGDVILIAVAGAYGKVMSSDYNLRGAIEEVFLPPAPGGGG